MQLNVQSGQPLLLKGYPELIDQGLEGGNEGYSPKQAPLLRHTEVL